VPSHVALNTTASFVTNTNWQYYGGVAMPLLEAVEHAALSAGVPVDAGIEKGPTLTHALQRLWDGHAGFTEKELAWLLTHAPTETVVLKPTPLVA